MQEQHYEFPEEMSLSKYFMDKKGVIFKKLNNGNLKLMSPHSGVYRLTDDHGNKIQKSPSFLKGVVFRFNDKYYNRKRLPKPIDSYEIMRDGMIYNMSFPENQLVTDKGNVELLGSDGKRYRFDVRDLVARLFVYGKVSEETILESCFLYKYSKEYQLKLSPNVGEMEVYLSKKNVMILNRDLLTHNVQFVNGLENICVIDGRRLVDSITGVDLLYINSSVGDTTRRFYKLKRYDFKQKLYLESTFYVYREGDEYNSRFV